MTTKTATIGLLQSLLEEQLLNCKVIYEFHEFSQYPMDISKGHYTVKIISISEKYGDEEICNFSVSGNAEYSYGIRFYGTPLQFIRIGEILKVLFRQG